MILIGMALAFLLSASCSTDKTEKEMKVPYQQSAASCYERLKETDSLYQKGVDQVLTVARSDDAFSKKLDTVLSFNESVIEKSRTVRSSKPWREEDVYLCCFFDLLEAMFASESETILKGSTSATEKRKGIEQLEDAVSRIQLSGPKWNQGAQVTIRKNLEEAKKNVQ
jgi:hypothetical protein